MRKLFFLLAILGITGLVACGESTTEEVTEDVTEEADAMAASLQEAVASMNTEIADFTAKLDAKIEASEGDAKVALEEMKTQVQEFSVEVQNASAENVDALKARWMEITSGMNTMNSETTEGGTNE